MAYSIRIEQIGETGTPKGRPIFHEADTEMEAVTLAASEVDAGGSGAQRVATVFNATGRLVLAYAGRAKGGDAR